MHHVSKENAQKQRAQTRPVEGPLAYEQVPGNESAFKRVAAWFPGPKGENAKVLQGAVTKAVAKLSELRKNYDTDPPYVTDDVSEGLVWDRTDAYL